MENTDARTFSNGLELNDGYVGWWQSMPDLNVLSIITLPPKAQKHKNVCRLFVPLCGKTLSFVSSFYVLHRVNGLAFALAGEQEDGYSDEQHCHTGQGARTGVAETRLQHVETSRAE